jgi:RNA polymerase sigma factor (sigma-70 family)
MDVNMVAKGEYLRPIRTRTARNEIVEANLALAGWMVNHWRLKFSMEAKRRYPYDEALADARAALVRAASLWRKRKGKFSTYARWWMFNFLQAGLRRSTIVDTPNQANSMRCEPFIIDDGETLRTECNMPVVHEDSEAERRDERAWLRDRIDAALASLRPRYRQAVELRMRDMTYVQIGKQMGVHRERVWQILARSYYLLGKRLGATMEQLRA